MKGLERITSVRLAEALSQTGLLPAEKISDALYQQDSSGIPFVEILVESGAVSEWDVAKVVVQHYQLPCLLPTYYEINPAALKCLPEDFLFRHRLLPLDLCGNVLTLSMPVLLPFKILEQAENLSKKEVFPLVGLGSENLKLLFQHFPNHPKEEARRKQGEKPAQEGPREKDSSWQNIFDLGDQEVLKDLEQ